MKNTLVRRNNSINFYSLDNIYSETSARTWTFMILVGPLQLGIVFDSVFLCLSAKGI